MDKRSRRLGNGAGLVDLLDAYYSVEEATTSAQMDEVHRLRYQVYCIDHRYEAIDDNPGQREVDIYDTNSVHALLRFRPTGEALGTVRIVLPGPGGLPIHGLTDCPELHDTAMYPPALTGEISRLAISRPARRRVLGVLLDAAAMADPVEAAKRKTVASLMVAGLLRAVHDLSNVAGLTHGVAVLENRLVNRLAMVGAHLFRLGSPVEYHGRRQPCGSAIDVLLERMAAEHPAISAYCTTPLSHRQVRKTFETYTRSI